MCVHTYILNKWEYSVGCHHNTIVVQKREKTKIDNGYTIKQYIILMCLYLHTE